MLEQTGFIVNIEGGIGMKRLYCVMLACLLFFGGVPAVMAGTVQMGHASTSMSITVSNGPNGPVVIAGGPTSGPGAPAISQEQALAIARGIFPEISNMDVKLPPKLLIFFIVQNIDVLNFMI